MKRLIAVLLVGIMLVSMTACSGRDTTPETPDDTDIIIDSTSDGEAAPTDGQKPDAKAEFALNTEYLELAGKTKREIDGKFGDGEYSMEFGLTDYKNGLSVGWNSSGIQPTDDMTATCMYISLDKLFLNCPEVVTVDQIKLLFPEFEESYDEMEKEIVLIVNYKGMPICFYPYSGLSRDSLAFFNAVSRYQASTKTEDTSAYYEYAKKHDAEFWEINCNWRDDRAYYYLADVDLDGNQELVVKLGCGIAVYKKYANGVETMYYNDLPDSSGSVNYYLARYDGHDYIAYASASSSEYRVLYTVAKDGLKEVKTSMIVGADCQINGKNVSQSEYDKYVNAIEYPTGVTIDQLK